MGRSQFIRRLRIVSSAFFAVVAMSLCVLWVRSYETFDNIQVNIGRGKAAVMRSYRGGTLLTVVAGQVPMKFYSPRLVDNASSPTLHTQAQFALKRSGVWLQLPHWVPIAAVSAAIALINVQYRFTLRTLRGATTLVAVVLGLGGGSVRRKCTAKSHRLQQILYYP